MEIVVGNHSTILPKKPTDTKGKETVESNDNLHPARRYHLKRIKNEDETKE